MVVLVVVNVNLRGSPSSCSSSLGAYARCSHDITANVMRKLNGSNISVYSDLEPNVFGSFHAQRRTFDLHGPDVIPRVLNQHGQARI
jgi:hypothetical protein